MEVVRRVRRAAGGVKTGHAGTLDPLATGVVVCCLGKATRCVEQIMGLTKVYVAEIDLSAFTTTDDAEGPRLEVSVSDQPTEARLREVLARFVGVVEQVPPAYSALHVGGRRAYDLARQGKEVTLTARPVRIDAIELMHFHWPMAKVKVICGRGTYIRSLARDIGKALGTGGYLTGLRRLAVGPYTVEKAVTHERLAQPIGQGDLVAVEVDK